MSVEAAIAAMIWTPLGAAIVALLVGRRGGALLSLGVAAALTALSLWLAQATLEHGPARHLVGGWGAPLGIELYLDGLGALMLGMTAVVAAAVTIYATGYFSGSHAGQGAMFWPVWLLMWGAMNALFLSKDIFNLYVTLELLTLSGVAMIGLAGKIDALAAALRYLLVALAGSLFYFLGVALIYGAYGTVDWELLGEVAGPGPAVAAAAALMTAGLALKTALFPLHFWLPGAHANAPAPVSAILSGLVLKASFFILLRLWFVVFPQVTTAAAAQLLGALGAAAILWGSAQAIRQRRVKMMIAYSTVAQIGYLFLLFSLAPGETADLAWQGAIYMALSHALAKGAAFMATGAVADALGGDEIDRWQGAAQRQPIALLAFALAGVSLMGLPPSGGFIAKWLLLKAALMQQRWELAAVMLLGGLLAAVYVFRVVATSLASAEAAPSQPVPRVMQWTPLVLALAAVALGVFAAQPMQLLEVGSPFPSPTERLP